VRVHSAPPEFDDIASIAHPLLARKEVNAWPINLMLYVMSVVLNVDVFVRVHVHSCL
jgi:hypothetical protein